MEFDLKCGGSFRLSGVCGGLTLLVLNENVKEQGFGGWSLIRTPIVFPGAFRPQKKCSLIFYGAGSI